MRFCTDTCNYPEGECEDACMRKTDFAVGDRVKVIKGPYKKAFGNVESRTLSEIYVRVDGVKEAIGYNLEELEKMQQVTTQPTEGNNMMTSVKIQVHLKTPQVPTNLEVAGVQHKHLDDAIAARGPALAIDIADLEDDALRELGRQWTEALLQMAKLRRTTMKGHK